MKLFLFTILFLPICLYAQDSDTLIIYFETNSSQLDQNAKNKIISFTKNEPPHTNFEVYGHTDDLGSQAFNLTLSQKRTRSVVDLLIEVGIDSNAIRHRYFGKLKPLVPNHSPGKRASNRRVEIIKTKLIPLNEVRLPKKERDTLIPRKKSNTLIQPNGIRIINVPETLQDEIRTNIENDINSFSLIENTGQMILNNIITTTVDGENLSSLVMICPPVGMPCEVDTPVVVSIPINRPIECPLDYIKFYNSADVDGRLVWSEIKTTFYEEIINDTRYINVTLPTPCLCINFDYKLEEPCFPVDTVHLKMPKLDSLNLQIVLEPYNGVYPAKKITNRLLEFIVPKYTKKGVYICAYIWSKSGKISYVKVKLEDLRFVKRKGYYKLSKFKLNRYIRKKKKKDKEASALPQEGQAYPTSIPHQ